MAKSILVLLLCAACVKADTTAKAKAAFGFAEIELKCQPDCKCESGNCTCTKNGKKCECKNCTCNTFDSDKIYAQAVKEGRVVVIEVGGVVHLIDTPWHVIPLRNLQGENAGYIVGVPKDGMLNRLDFSVYNTKQTIRMGILHFLYPLTPGYAECPNCPTGRIWVGK